MQLLHHGDAGGLPNISSRPIIEGALSEDTCAGLECTVRLPDDALQVGERTPWQEGSEEEGTRSSRR